MQRNGFWKRVRGLLAIVLSVAMVLETPNTVTNAERFNDTTKKTEYEVGKVPSADGNGREGDKYIYIGEGEVIHNLSTDCNPSFLALFKDSEQIKEQSPSFTDENLCKLIAFENDSITISGLDSSYEGWYKWDNKPNWSSTISTDPIVVHHYQAYFKVDQIAHVSGTGGTFTFSTDNFQTSAPFIDVDSTMGEFQVKFVPEGEELPEEGARWSWAALKEAGWLVNDSDLNATEITLKMPSTYQSGKSDFEIQAPKQEISLKYAESLVGAEVEHYFLKPEIGSNDPIPLPSESTIAPGSLGWLKSDKYSLPLQGGSITYSYLGTGTISASNFQEPTRIVPGYKVYADNASFATIVSPASRANNLYANSEVITLKIPTAEGETAPVIRKVLFDGKNPISQGTVTLSEDKSSVEYKVSNLDIVSGTARVFPQLISESDYVIGAREDTALDSSDLTPGSNISLVNVSTSDMTVRFVEANEEITAEHTKKTPITVPASDGENWKLVQSSATEAVFSSGTGTLPVYFVEGNTIPTPAYKAAGDVVEFDITGKNYDRFFINGKDATSRFTINGNKASYTVLAEDVEERTDGITGILIQPVKAGGMVIASNDSDGSSLNLDLINTDGNVTFYNLSDKLVSFRFELGNDNSVHEVAINSIFSGDHAWFNETVDVPNRSNYTSFGFNSNSVWIYKNTTQAETGIDILHYELTKTYGLILNNATFVSGEGLVNDASSETLYILPDTTVRIKKSETASEAAQIFFYSETGQLMQTITFSLVEGMTDVYEFTMPNESVVVKVIPTYGVSISEARRVTVTQDAQGQNVYTNQSAFSETDKYQIGETIYFSVPNSVTQGASTKELWGWKIHGASEDSLVEKSATGAADATIKFVKSDGPNGASIFSVVVTEALLKENTIQMDTIYAPVIKAYDATAYNNDFGTYESEMYTLLAAEKTAATDGYIYLVFTEATGKKLKVQDTSTSVTASDYFFKLSANYDWVAIKEEGEDISLQHAYSATITDYKSLLQSITFEDMIAEGTGVYFDVYVPEGKELVGFNVKQGTDEAVEFSLEDMAQGATFIKTASGSGYEYSFVMPSKNVTVAPIFATLYKVTIPEGFKFVELGTDDKLTFTAKDSYKKGDAVFVVSANDVTPTTGYYLSSNLTDSEKSNETCTPAQDVEGFLSNATYRTYYTFDMEEKNITVVNNGMVYKADFSDCESMLENVKATTGFMTQDGFFSKDAAVSIEATTSSGELPVLTVVTMDDEVSVPVTRSSENDHEFTFTMPEEGVIVSIVYTPVVTLTLQGKTYSVGADVPGIYTITDIPEGKKIVGWWDGNTLSSGPDNMDTYEEQIIPTQAENVYTITIPDSEVIEPLFGYEINYTDTDEPNYPSGTYIRLKNNTTNSGGYVYYEDDVRADCSPGDFRLDGGSYTVIKLPQRDGADAVWKFSGFDSNSENGVRFDRVYPKFSVNLVNAKLVSSEETEITVGATVQVEVDLPIDKRFEVWNVKDTDGNSLNVSISLVPNTQNIYQFTMPAQDIEIEATYEQLAHVQVVGGYLDSEKTKTEGYYSAMVDQNIYVYVEDDDIFEYNYVVKSLQDGEYVEDSDEVLQPAATYYALTVSGKDIQIELTRKVYHKLEINQFSFDPEEEVLEGTFEEGKMARVYLGEVPTESRYYRYTAWVLQDGEYVLCTKPQVCNQAGDEVYIVIQDADMKVDITVVEAHQVTLGSGITIEDEQGEPLEGYLEEGMKLYVKCAIPEGYVRTGILFAELLEDGSYGPAKAMTSGIEDDKEYVLMPKADGRITLNLTPGLWWKGLVQRVDEEGEFFDSPDLTPGEVAYFTLSEEAEGKEVDFVAETLVDGEREALEYTKTATGWSIVLPNTPVYVTGTEATLYSYSLKGVDEPVSAKYRAGTAVSFETADRPRQRFLNWLATNAAGEDITKTLLTSATEKKQTITMPAHDVVIQAVFEMEREAANYSVKVGAPVRLAKGIPYKFEAGKTWKVKGDSTSYAGGMTFYVATDAEYEFE